MKLIVELVELISRSRTKAKRLGENRQVCVITHSPRVASVGQNHYKVTKSKFETKLIKLDRTREYKRLVRMLSAESNSRLLKLQKNLLTTQVKFKLLSQPHSS